MTRCFCLSVLRMESTLHKPGGTEHPSAKHLCVLVHGLWGNGSHLNYLSQSLRDKYDEDQLVVLVCKRNASSFTYDGIEIGAERVMKEIEVCRIPCGGDRHSDSLSRRHLRN